MSERDNLPSENDFLGLPVLSQSSSDERYRDGSNSLESIGPLYDLLDDDDRRGALSQGECSLPTGHDTPSDESVGNRSRCGSNDAVAEEPPEEFDLIDLEYQYSLVNVQIPEEILLTVAEQMRVGRDLERAAEGADLSDKLTGDSSGGSQERFKDLEIPTSRHSELRFDDRCTTPTRSKQGGLPQSPSSPNSQRTDWTTTKSEVYRFTYETANPSPRSPVPPYVFVHPGGLARVTVSHTDRIGHTSAEFMPEPIPNQRDRSRNEGLLSQICLYTLLAILFLALVTLGAGLAKTRELNQIDQENGRLGDAAAWLTPIPTPVPWMTNHPSQSSIVAEAKPTPPFVIPIDAAPSSNGGLPPSLLKEGETTEPIGDPPTRPPREQRTRAPSSAPSEITMPPALLKEGGTDPPLADPPSRPPRERRTHTPSAVPSESSYPSSDTSDYQKEIPLTVSQEYAMRYIKAIVSYESPTSIPYLNDPTETSPHFKALRWLAKEDMVLEKYSNDKIIQRWVLAAFYFSTISDEKSWSNSTGWLQYTDECSWYSRDSRGMCNSEGDVRILDLQHNGLVGTILPEISLLSNSLSRLRYALPIEVPADWIDSRLFFILHAS